MKVSQKGIDLIKEYEGCRLEAYTDIIGKLTIGWGSTHYKNGSKVKLGDTITQDQADELLGWEAENKATVISALLPDLNQNQLDSLTDFSYNLGIGAFQSSTLLKKAKIDVNDPTIAAEFLRWDKARINGKLEEVPGLKRRRQEEADMYISA